MPLHDWTRLHAGEFHHFHNGWLFLLADRLNKGLLPEDHYALTDSEVDQVRPDVLTLSTGDRDAAPPYGDPGSRQADSYHFGGATAALDAPPAVALEAEVDEAAFRAINRKSLRIRHVSGNRVVALVEIVSPGNKDRAATVQSFVNKTARAIKAGIHVVVLDVFPARHEGPGGLGVRVWHEAGGKPVAVPPERPLIQTSVRVDDGAPHLYAQPLAVGDELPELPLFYDPDWYVTLPLAETYQAAYESVPWQLRRQLDAA